MAKQVRAFRRGKFLPVLARVACSLTGLLCCEEGLLAPLLVDSSSLRGCGLSQGPRLAVQAPTSWRPGLQGPATSHNSTQALQSHISYS